VDSPSGNEQRNLRIAANDAARLRDWWLNQIKSFARSGRAGGTIQTPPRHHATSKCKTAYTCAELKFVGCGVFRELSASFAMQALPPIVGMPSICSRNRCTFFQSCQNIGG
jgi:hypothetical protein